MVGNGTTKGVMKRAVKWESMSVDRRPGRKEQYGRHQPVEKGRMVDVD